ncbi:MAG: hypothetical protein J7K20_01990 [Thermodesulfobacterium sp.]|nr:hypothetical protein [Thermodesulfobacterium sp.]
MRVNLKDKEVMMLFNFYTLIIPNNIKKDKIKIKEVVMLLRRFRWWYYLIRGVWRRQFKKRLYTYDDLDLYGSIMYERGWEDAMRRFKEDLCMGILPDEIDASDLEEALDKLRDYRIGEDFLSI